MLAEWVDMCTELMFRPADEWASNRKILHGVTWTMEELDETLTLEDCGYTRSKMSMLRRLYLVEASRDGVVPLWEKRRDKQRKYGSVSFTCCGHHTKSDPTKGSKRASVMTPCIQSVSLTYHGDHTTEAHAFYRTTELFKKFPADLVFLRDELLPPFGMTDRVTFMFANVTLHPMYFAVLMPHLNNPVAILSRLREGDRKFHDYIVKATSRYLIPRFHRGIEKHSQSMSVYRDVIARTPQPMIDLVVPYLEEHHTGFRTDYEGEDE